MSTELSGRALDEAVARAMAWTTRPCGHRCNCTQWVHPNGHDVAAIPSTLDVSRIPAMLDWFDERGIELVLGSNPKSTDWTKWEAEAMADPPFQCRMEHGATIQQAIARLVVAVKEAQQ